MLDTFFTIPRLWAVSYQKNGNQDAIYKWFCILQIIWIVFAIFTFIMSKVQYNHNKRDTHWSIYVILILLSLPNIMQAIGVLVFAGVIALIYSFIKYMCKFIFETGKTKSNKRSKENMFNREIIENLTNRIDVLERYITNHEDERRKDRDYYNVRFFVIQNPNGKVYEEIGRYSNRYLGYQAIADGEIKSTSIEINGKLQSYKVYKNNDATYIEAKIKISDIAENNTITNYYVISICIDSIIQLDSDMSDKFKNCEWVEYKQH